MDVSRFLKDKVPLSVTVVGLAMACYHMVYTQVFLQATKPHLNTHLGFCLVLVVLDQLTKAKTKWSRIWLFFLILLSLLSVAYVQLNWQALEERAYFNTTFDLIIGVILIVLVLEATRRSFGLILPVLAIVVGLYPFIGKALPEPFRCTAYSLDHTIANV